LTTRFWLIEFRDEENFVANLITISRFPLLLIFELMLYLGDHRLRLIGVPLLFVALVFDSIDGIVARRMGNTTLTGSVLDIAADRVYELILWVSLADLDLIPVAIPLIVITRTTLTDAIRSIGVQRGKAPFDQHSSKLGTFIVGSRWMRSSYGISKVLSFCGLTLGLSFSGYPVGSPLRELSEPLLMVFRIISWVAVSLCVIRGSPVILGALRRSFQKRDNSTKRA
jgi:phosphatidylglycerophosphate synthase